ncbi:MAG: YraN family protein [Bacteroidales bacterium]|nr:YraN family protein [Bacteroidales bacterium]
MAGHNETGQTGEDFAVRYLKEKGYAILETNWRSFRYEIDIIAEYAGELIIVEVKTRSGHLLQLPEDAVDTRKIRHLVIAADTFVKQREISLPVRFDVLTVTIENGAYTVNHIEDAFYPPMG